MFCEKFAFYLHFVCIEDAAIIVRIGPAVVFFLHQSRDIPHVPVVIDNMVHQIRRIRKFNFGGLCQAFLNCLATKLG